jgi:hypothetical protein
MMTWAYCGGYGADVGEAWLIEGHGAENCLIVFQDVSSVLPVQLVRVFIPERLRRIGQWLHPFAVLTDRRKGSDIPMSDLPDSVVQLGKRGIPLRGLQFGIASLEEDQRFVQRLSAGPKVGQVRVVSAGTFRQFERWRSLAATQSCEDGVKRPVEHEHHGARIRQRRSDRFHKQQINPSRPNLDATLEQGLS